MHSLLVLDHIFLARSTSQPLAVSSAELWLSDAKKRDCNLLQRQWSQDEKYWVCVVSSVYRPYSHWIRTSQHKEVKKKTLDYSFYRNASFRGKKLKILSQISCGRSLFIWNSSKKWKIITEWNMWKIWLRQRKGKEMRTLAPSIQIFVGWVTTIVSINWSISSRGRFIIDCFQCLILNSVTHLPMMILT
jgi:hypothetical protein